MLSSLVIGAMFFAIVLTHHQRVEVVSVRQRYFLRVAKPIQFLPLLMKLLQDRTLLPKLLVLKLLYQLFVLFIVYGVSLGNIHLFSLEHVVETVRVACLTCNARPLLDRVQLLGIRWLPRQHRANFLECFCILLVFILDGQLV